MGRRSREKTTRQGAERLADGLPSRIAPVTGTTLEAGWRTHLTTLAAIGALALAYRVALLVELADTPYLEVANVDSRSYQQWALEIAAGHWAPAKLFYQAPFYAYFLAAVSAAFGEGPWAPRVIQVLLGSLSPLLLYAIGATLFTRRVGLIAGIALALYGPLVLEEITLSKTSPLVFLTLASFAAYLHFGGRAHVAGLALAGALSGLAVVAAAQSFLPFVVLAACAWFVPANVSRRQRWAGAAAFAGAGLVVLGPVVAWNSFQGGGLVLTAGGAGLNLYAGNNPRALGLPAPAPGVRDVPEYEEEDARREAERAVGHPLRAAAVDRYWAGRAFDFIGAHPVDYAVRLANKTVVLWNAYEVPDNYHYAFVRAYFLPWLWLGITFAAVGPLALAGLVVARSRSAGVRVLYLTCLAYLAIPILYYVRGRYRMPAVPFLIVFAAVAVDRVLDVVVARRWRAASGWAAVLLVTGVFVNHVHCEPTHDGMRRVCLGGDTWFDVEWKRLAEWYQRHGDRERERAYVERALECTDPREPADTYLWVAWLESREAGGLFRTGNTDEAEHHFKRAEGYFQAAIALDTRVAYANAELGGLYASMGMPEKAFAALEEGRRKGAADRETLVALGAGYAALGHCREAATLLADADQGAVSEATARILAGCVGP